VKFRFPVLSTAIAVVSGVVILFFYFFPSGRGGEFRILLFQWATTLAAVALLVGVINLLSVHAKKTEGGGAQAAYSGILILSLIITFVVVLVWGPNGEAGSWIFNYIQIPVESSLMAFLAISLVYASIRLLRRRMNGFSVIFVLTVLFILLGNSPLATGEIPLISDWLLSFRGWIARVPAAAGARGILLGVALGTIATGLRIVMGADRPYSS
jgi:hypothetical protein